ncbi:spermidine/putrescine ABC transporter substrate-binding protein [Rhodobacteraceae bacterium HSP-20]|uniref:Spermidine/putrescine ABC transporter substrate-binding protein n=1 Tax=Paragemmobacter amnigenus TaxID=2852097 RepID=A0ABS6J2C8_9RHOB|nr:spermidine/putrescine ABC transporter substrate-binding protein [Rhodobacter amnigenus]MBU9697687.1 spermidine/putrescine ABC transporter substrate-binding protein [Rhodobacter amnigenus]MBV4388914.1 spermidine/putrescine ABC transporter substrate-binding protein [Rhodobacter amnigenus]
MQDDKAPITRQKFIEELLRYRKGSVTRRHFLGVTGLGTAMAVMGGGLPLLSPRRAFAQGIGDQVVLATWPNYHDPANFDAFAAETGAAVQVNVFGSNEEMLAKLQAGGSGWDVFVPTNYTITTYVEADLIEPLDLSKLPNYDAASFEARFADAGTVDGKLYAVPKNWGTTGMAWDSSKAKAPFTSWKEFFDVTRTDFSGRTMVHDYQLTTIGNALKYFGYSFNSVDPAELADAEKLLIEIKPHLFAISSDYQPAMRNGDAWLTMCWTGEGKQMNRDIPEILFAVGKDGGEIWSDYYAIPKNAPHRDAAYALINYLIDPAVNAREAAAHGFPVADARVNALLPPEVLSDPILYPAAELLNAQEFGAAVTLTDPNRAEVMARFKSA